MHYFNSVFTDGRRRKHGKNPGRPIVFELFPKLCHVTEETIEDDYKERVDRRLKPMEVPQNHFKKKKTVFITGGGSGFGQATAVKFANSGEFNLVICDLDGLDQTESMCLATNRIKQSEILKLTFDVTNEEDHENAFKQTLNK